MSEVESARAELSNGNKKLDQISSEILVALIKQDRSIEGDISILQIDAEENKVQAFVKKHDSDFWYSFEKGEFNLFSCTYEIKRPN